MPGKPLSAEHQVWLLTLIERYGSRRLVRLIEKRQVAARRAGRPANHRGNLLAVYCYVEHHRKQKTTGGRSLGISGAVGRLKKVSDAYIVNFGVTESRLRAMYYEAKRDFPAADLAGATAKPYADGTLPLLLKKRADGSLASSIIDRAGRGGH